MRSSVGGTSKPPNASGVRRFETARLVRGSLPVTGKAANRHRAPNLSRGDDVFASGRSNRLEQ